MRWSKVTSRGVACARTWCSMRCEPSRAKRSCPSSCGNSPIEDAPLPIAEGQTISQPYIVALMTEALELEGGEEVLEIGTGSGYAAAVLSQIARKVYTVERIGQLAEKAAAALADLGYRNVHVLHADGTLGWPEHAPYDAIVVAAGGPEVPESLKEQLKIGGRLVIPVGTDRRVQELVRVTRVSERRIQDRGHRRCPLRPAGRRGRLGAARSDRAAATAPARRPAGRQATGQGHRGIVRAVRRRSTRRTSSRCCGGSATRASCCSAKRRMAPPSSIACASASRAS